MPTESDPDSIEIPSWLRELLGEDEALRIANHWVPLTYLKHFTDTGDADGTFFLYDHARPHAPRGNVSPRVVARENLLYVNEAATVLPDMTERALSLIERPYSELRRRLIRSYRLGGFYADLDPVDRSNLATFIAAQQLRTPYRRDVSNAMLSILATVSLVGELHDVEAVQDRFEKEGGTCPDSETIERMRQKLQDGELFLKPEKAHWHLHFLRLIEEVAPMIARLPYRVIQAHSEVEFPTSDLPVVHARRARGSLEYEPHAGWLESEAEATITLDPRHVLVIGPQVDDDTLDSREWARSVVKRTIESANRFAFARKEDRVISDYLSRSEPPRTVLEVEGKEYDLLSTSTDDILRAIQESRASVIRVGRPGG